MESAIARFFDEHVPPFNPKIIEGLAVERMQLCEQYIHTVLQNVSRSFPEGFRYEGPPERCSPREEYLDHAKESSGRRTFNIARSSVYMMRYKFSLFGKPLQPRYIFLPFVEDYGVIWLSGSPYHMKPMLSHKVIAPMDNSVFVRLLCDRITFYRDHHEIRINEHNETTTVVWSTLYRKDTKMKTTKRTNAHSTAMHYLLARFGFTETFRRFAGFVPIVGKASEINEKNYSYEEYVLVSSTSRRGFSTAYTYQASGPDIVVAVPIQYWNHKVKAMLSGFFYVVDHFPTRVTAEYLDSQYMWMVLLGGININVDYGDGRLYQRMEKHFKSLDDYVDSIHREKLAEQGVVVNDFYDLLATLIERFDEWTSEAASRGNSVYGKSVDVLYSALFEITRSIFMMTFQLTDMAADGKIGPDDVKKVERALQQIKRGSIYKLSSDSPIVANVDCSGDNAYMRMTSHVAVQEGPPASQRGGGNRKVVSERAHLDPSAIVFGSVLFLPKAEPTPLTRINPYAEISPDGTVQESEKLKPTMTKLSELYQVRRV